MDENERSEEIGEVVPPAEDGSAEQRDSAPTPQSHEDNRRFQAARLGGERAGYERAMRELAGRESERRSREEEQMRFIAEDAREFARRYPEADLAGLDASESFRRFCGSRYASCTRIIWRSPAARCGPRRREGKAGLHGLRAAAAAGPMRRSTPGSSRSWTRGTARFRR